MPANKWTTLKAEECACIGVIYDKEGKINRYEILHKNFSGAKWFYVSKNGNIIRLEHNKKFVINGTIKVKEVVG